MQTTKHPSSNALSRSKAYWAFAAPKGRRTFKLMVLLLLLLPFGKAGMGYAQIITTVAGNGTAGYSGDGGQATNAELYSPIAVEIDNAGNIYIADANNIRIRKVNTLGVITTIVGNGTSGYSGDGGMASSAQISRPYGIAIDATGNIYFIDSGNNRVREINTSGIITTIAGNGTTGYTGDGGAATQATLNLGTAIATDKIGNIYISCSSNNVIRKINTLGIISTIAGNGTAGDMGDGGLATNSELYYPEGIAIDKRGNIFIADLNNNKIRKIDTTGIITTFAGNMYGSPGFGGDGGLATSALLSSAQSVAVDTLGNVYIADWGNDRVRIVDTSGIINTYAGNGTFGFSGDGGLADYATLGGPGGVGIDNYCNLYIVDEDNNRIRKVTNSVYTTGIQQIANDNNEQVMVYPNPANTSLNLTLSKGEGTSTFIMFDMMGNTVKQSIIYNLTSIINIVDLAEGIYNISIINKEGCLNKKIIIVR
jgi:sugar lactone lactonase YvrE